MPTKRAFLPMLLAKHKNIKKKLPVPFWLYTPTNTTAVKSQKGAQRALNSNYVLVSKICKNTQRIIKDSADVSLFASTTMSS